MSRHLTDAELLDLLLEGDDLQARREALAEDPSAAARAAELEAFLGDCRTVLGADEGEAADRADHSDLVGRILADTTREDPGWRGDLRLIRGFVGQRMRDSVLLRVVAASLLAHVLLVPVGAWALFAEDEESEPVHITFEIPREDAGLSGSESAEELGASDPRSIVDPEVLAAERAENLLRRHAYLLAHGALPELSPDSVDGSLDASGEAPLEIRLLVARSRGDGLAEEERETLATEVLGGPSPLALALLADLRLDRLATTGERGDDLATLFTRLGALAAEAGDDGPDARLARLVLERAHAYGAWEWGSSPDDPGLGSAPRTPVRPADGVAALADALAQRGLGEHPVARIWTADAP